VKRWFWIKVSVIGSGYVGTTTALCLAELGHSCVNIDVNQDVVDKINDAESPYSEPRFDELLTEHVPDNLRATTKYSDIIQTDITFLCLPTPSRDDGSIDLSVMEAGAESVGQALSRKQGTHTVIVKSTVTPGTTEHLGTIIAEESGKPLNDDRYMASNPEFLREGSAVNDFLDPDKIVLGGPEEALNHLRLLYTDLISDTELVQTDITAAETIKYVNNALLATKISFANEVGNVCKELGIDTYEVMDAVALDDRIERSFLDSGAGFGGSCFPKDVAALAAEAKDLGIEPRILNAALEVNEEQPLRAVEILESRAGDLSGSTVAVLGLAFKPGTDDIRESRSIPVIEELQERGASVVAHDPEATEKMQKIFPDIDYAESAQGALQDSDTCLIMTAWPQYRELDIDVPTVEGKRMDLAEGVCW